MSFSLGASATFSGAFFNRLPWASSYSCKDIWSKGFSIGLNSWTGASRFAFIFSIYAASCSASVISDAGFSIGLSSVGGADFFYLIFSACAASYSARVISDAGFSIGLSSVGGADFFYLIFSACAASYSARVISTPPPPNAGGLNSISSSSSNEAWDDISRSSAPFVGNARVSNAASPKGSPLIQQRKCWTGGAFGMFDAGSTLASTTLVAV
jgi:hypothetical protein